MVLVVVGGLGGATSFAVNACALEARRMSASEADRLFGTAAALGPALLGWPGR